MNERKFLRELKSEANKDRDLTLAIVEGLLSEGQALTVRGRFNIFSRFLLGNWKKSVSQIIEDNFEDILDRTAYSQLNVLLERLMKNWQTSEIVKEKFDAVIRRISFVTEKEQNYNDAVTVGLKKNKFYSMCRKTYTYADDLFVKHIDTIMQGGVTIEELKYLRGISKETDEKLNSKLESEKQKVAREMLGSISSLAEKSKEEGQQLISDYIPTMTRMIEELLMDQNARMIDIARIGKGGYSKAYQIEEKVLKIGRPRETYKIPNHPRILQPLTRTNLLDERDNNKIFGCIEISDRVDRLCENKKQEQELNENEEAIEKLYQVYKELRDDGIVWTDVRFSNIGKLRRRNVPKLNGEEMNVDPEAVGMDREIKGKVLEVGEWVIIDTDYIYRQEDYKSITYTINPYFKQFEKRWKQEKQGRTPEKYHSNEVTRTQGGSTKHYEAESWEIRPEEER